MHTLREHKRYWDVVVDGVNRGWIDKVHPHPAKAIVKIDDEIKVVDLGQFDHVDKAIKAVIEYKP